MKGLELVFVSKKTFGKYTGTLEWYVKDDVWIDNCFKSTVTDRAGNILEIIDEIRPIPEKIKPDRVVPPPIEGNPPIEGTGKLWYFDPRYISEHYVFEPPLKAPVIAWVIKTDGISLIFDGATGKRIGIRKPEAGGREEAEAEAELSLGEWYSKYRTGGKPIIGKCPPNAKFGGVSWTQFTANAKIWFEIMGVPYIWKSVGYAKEVIQNSDVKYFHCAAHGDWKSSTAYTVDQVTQWMADRPPMYFAQLDHCLAMSKTGKGSLSYAFRKGSMKDTVTIGLAPPSWHYLRWENQLFMRMVDGETWGDAFDYADAIISYSDSYVFCGDRNMKLTPEYESPLPTKSYITCTTSPSNARIWLKKH